MIKSGQHWKINVLGSFYVCSPVVSLRQLAKTLVMGQGLAGLICGTAITSQYLATNFHVDTPMLQSFLNYTLLCATYTTMLLCKTGNPTTQGLSQGRYIYLYQHK